MTSKNSLLTNWKKEWKMHEYSEPTEIQMILYEPIKKGRDVLAISPTGTGKTVAYTLPVLEKITNKKELQWLVLAPSHELVMQITETIRSWIPLEEITVLPIIGGANSKRQIEKLKKKPQIIVASPGRVLELIEQKKIKTHEIKTITLDECDQLLLPENRKTIQMIINRAMKNRQLILVSATAPKELENFVNQTASDLERYEIKIAKKGIQNTHHFYMEVENRDKGALLRRLIGLADMRALVFVRDRPRMDILLTKLTYHGVKAAGIHSEVSKEIRKKTLSAFKKEQLDYLIVTDIAARGLDIPDLPYVIHYDLAKNEKEYTHRSGRTGRMGKKGQVITFANHREIRSLKQFLQKIGKKGEKVRFYKGELYKDTKTNKKKENQ